MRQLRFSNDMEVEVNHSTILKEMKMVVVVKCNNMVKLFVLWERWRVVIIWRLW